MSSSPTKRVHYRTKTLLSHSPHRDRFQPSRISEQLCLPMGECLSLNLAFDREYRKFLQKGSRRLRGKKSFVGEIESVITVGGSDMLVSFTVDMGWKGTAGLWPLEMFFQVFALCSVENWQHSRPQGEEPSILPKASCVLWPFYMLNFLLCLKWCLKYKSLILHAEV